jgi:hypothetical protein
MLVVERLQLVCAYLRRCLMLIFIGVFPWNNHSNNDRDGESINEMSELPAHEKMVLGIFTRGPRAM